MKILVLGALGMLEYSIVRTLATANEVPKISSTDINRID